MATLWMLLNEKDRSSIYRTPNLFPTRKWTISKYVRFVISFYKKENPIKINILSFPSTNRKTKYDKKIMANT